MKNTWIKNGIKYDVKELNILVSFPSNDVLSYPNVSIDLINNNYQIPTDTNKYS